jgi:hypothetical protein
VNYNYVKVLAKKRSQICQEILDASLSHFPSKVGDNKISSEVAQTVETFFLLDHCSEVEGESNSAFFKVGGTARYVKGGGGDESDTDSVKSGTQSKARGGGGGGKNIFEDAVENVGNFIKKTLPLDDIGGLMTPRAGTGNADNAASGMTSPVVPISRKSRKSVVLRKFDDDELKAVGEEASLLLDDERLHTELVPSYSHPVPNFQSRGSKIGDLLDNNPHVFALIAVASIIFLKSASTLTATMDLDILMLLIWAAFCIGLHTPRPMISGIDRHFGPPPPTPTMKKKRPTVKTGEDRDGRKLLRMSFASTPDASHAAAAVTFDSIREEEDHDDIMEVNQSPLPMFPPGAELGTKFNCWSQPPSTNFHVRGPKYLKDKVKIESADFVFPCRGIDLFLTDTCPENAGRWVVVMFLDCCRPLAECTPLLSAALTFLSLPLPFQQYWCHGRTFEGDSDLYHQLPTSLGGAVVLQRDPGTILAICQGRVGLPSESRLFFVRCAKPRFLCALG